MIKKRSFRNFIETWSSKITRGAGSTAALVLACLLVIVWGISGALFGSSYHWQTIMGNSSSVVTFLMVFLIQKSQNKHSLSIQLKLNELVAANEFASNRLVNVEGMTEDELKIIEKYYLKLGDFAKKQENLLESHSIDEINQEHQIKNEMEKELIDEKKKTD
jgi:low affinity Fe/Cu permease